jgi:hypothetical protein
MQAGDLLRIQDQLQQDRSPVPFEILDVALVFFGGCASRKSAEIAPLAGGRIEFA